MSKYKLTDKQRIKVLLRACRTLQEDCRMALDGSWDKGDEGFRASLEFLETSIEQATEQKR